MIVVKSSTKKFELRPAGSTLSSQLLHKIFNAFPQIPRAYKALTTLDCSHC